MARRKSDDDLLRELTAQPDGQPARSIGAWSLKKLADAASIYQDLSFVTEVLERLNTLLEDGSTDNVLIQSYWTAALISYARCFSTGKRFGLPEQIFEKWEGAIETHRVYKNLRDKHVAHSVNPFEQVVVGLVLSAPGSEKRQVEGVATLSQRLITQTSEGVETLLKLAKYAGRIVTEYAKNEEAKVREVGETLPIEQLNSKPRLRTTAPGPEEAGKPRS